MFGKIGLPELVLILAIALIIFGPRKLPEIGKSIGRGIREFRQATSEAKKSVSLEEDYEGDYEGDYEEDGEEKSTTENKKEKSTAEAISDNETKSSDPYSDAPGTDEIPAESDAVSNVPEEEKK